MKIRSLFISLSVILASGIFILSSCTKPAAGSQGPQGPAGPAYTGSIFGFVSLYDQYGVKQNVNNLNPFGVMNIKVTIDGTAYRALTDASGKYTFNNLPSGIYNLTFADTIIPALPVLGYAPNCVKNINLVLGASQHDVHLGQIPAFAISATAKDSVAKSDSLNWIKISGTTSYDTQGREVLVFASGASSVSYLPANYVYVTAAAITANKTTFSVNMLESTLIDAGFPSGSTVYFMVYPTGVNYASASEYEDLTTSRIVYNEVGAAPILCSIVLP
jgi:hypothetical protein